METLTAPSLQWVPLDALRSRFVSNLRSLAGREPAIAAALAKWNPCETYHISAAGEQILIGMTRGGIIEPLPSRLPAVAARKLIAGLYPTGCCNQPILVAGEDLGWLLDGLYKLPSYSSQLPGVRWPIYFLVHDLERLWIMLHVQDWQALLADARVRLFAGDTAAEQFRRGLTDDDWCPWPKLAATVEPAVWAGSHFDAVLLAAKGDFDEQVSSLRGKLVAAFGSVNLEALARRMKDGSPIKVLGITSRYTTFLQYSMRDWLAAFERMGHSTRLVIEQQDHQAPNGLSLGRVCMQYRPDLILAIDHFRAELNNVPAGVPVVMWVQDRLPTIYTPNAGQRQGRLDYTIGYGRGELTQRFGFPAARFLPTMMAVNETRFSTAPLSQHEQDHFTCDVSFVTHCTVPAEQLVQDEIARSNSPLAAKLLDDIFQQLRGIYDAGGWVTSGEKIRAILLGAMADNKVHTEIGPLMDLFTHRVNNALFRHQAIRWVAELGVNLHLYGKGWEQHPEFARFARGVADNENELSAIYRASAINLQVTPFSAVHPRLLDGIAAGGFFLIRSVTADQLEPLLHRIGAWCHRRRIGNGAEMVERRDGELNELFSRYAELDGIDPASRPDYFFSAAEEVLLSGATRTPNALWDRESGGILFSTCAQLQERVGYFLRHAAEREATIVAMRQRVLETHTYGAISRRMLAFIGNDLTSGSLAAAA